jgi:hypothetical protein
MFFLLLVVIAQWPHPSEQHHHLKCALLGMKADEPSGRSRKIQPSSPKEVSQHLSMLILEEP